MSSRKRMAQFNAHTAIPKNDAKKSNRINAICMFESHVSTTRSRMNMFDSERDKKDRLRVKIAFILKTV